MLPSLISVNKMIAKLVITLDDLWLCGRVCTVELRTSTTDIWHGIPGNVWAPAALGTVRTLPIIVR
jgi:hypothetical protein